MTPPTAQTAADVRGATFPNGGLALTVPDELLEALACRVAELLVPLISAPAGSPWLTVTEAAEHMRCKPKRIYDLISQHRLPAHRDGGRVLLRRDELDAYLLGDADTLLAPGADRQPGRAFSGAQRTVSSRASGREAA